MLEEFAIQFTHLPFELVESFPSTRSGAIEAPFLGSGAYRCRTQVSFLFEAMENGVEGAGAQFISVMGQFLDDAQSEDRFFRSMMEDMKANETANDVTIDFRYRHATLSLYVLDAGAKENPISADIMVHVYAADIPMPTPPPTQPSLSSASFSSWPAIPAASRQPLVVVKSILKAFQGAISFAKDALEVWSRVGPTITTAL
jgi:hypothetical protein